MTKSNEEIVAEFKTLVDGLSPLELELVRGYIEYSGESLEMAESFEPMWEAMDCPDVTDDPFYSGF